MNNTNRSGKTPSAPPLDVMPMEQPLETTIPLQGGHEQDYNTSMPNQPPPSYQEAVNYPVAPPYPTYEPNSFPNAPNASAAHQVYPPYSNYSATGTGPPIHTIHIPTQQPATTTHIHYNTTTTTTSVPPTRPNPCSFCTGSVESETDICCLLCLILLAIFTFPFGLILLFCIPCTVRRRCNICRRLYE